MKAIFPMRKRSSPPFQGLVLQALLICSVLVALTRSNAALSAPSVDSSVYLPLVICSSDYSIQSVQNSANTEYRISKSGHHFMTYVDAGGAAIFRPHPGNDANGWGSSWYAQPFLPGATLKHTQIKSIHAECNNVYLEIEGKVSSGSNATAGTWRMILTMMYDHSSKQIDGRGTYVIDLTGPLSQNTGDLNLYKIASNYLHNVPLLSGGTGDTGDMHSTVVTGRDFTFTWVPTKQPSHFPTDRSSQLSVDVLGQYNNVDNAKLSKPPIQPAYKPNLRIMLASRSASTGITFGGIYNTDESQNFAADNVGITPLIPKDTTDTHFEFDVTIESTPIAGDP
jgi:hypothetical protein